MKTESILIMGDNHGNLACPETLAVIAHVKREFKPTFRFHLGDNWELASLRKGVDKDSVEADEGAIDSDLRAGQFWLEHFEPTHMAYGNHEARVFDLLHGTDSMKRRRKAESIIAHMNRAVRSAGCRRISEYTVWENFQRIGPAVLGHGFSHGQKAVLQDALEFSGPGDFFGMGHIHRMTVVNPQRTKGGLAASSGAACRIRDQRYLSKRKASLTHQNGFLLLHFIGEKYKLEQIHRWHGKSWWLPGGGIYTPSDAEIKLYSKHLYE